MKVVVKSRGRAKKNSGTPAKISGTAGFSANWKHRAEALVNHWTAGDPENQIQLAFRKHWELFRERLGDKNSGKCLEVGCGRGTISSYFASAGYDCTLLDYSAEALDLARAIFGKAGWPAKFIRGDANALPFKDGSFDVVVSIGLLEHFENVEKPLREQWRVLKPGGTCLAYIVPERPDNVQRYFRWVNLGLKLASPLWATLKAVAAKAEVYRSDFGSERYLDVVRDLSVTDVFVSGVYPLPMISHSPEFPFSLLPKPLEGALTSVFQAVLAARKKITGRNPWLCDEKFGQAFLVSFRKGK
jgi:ubiquinone/menaquinone biosynthesis C-methylase UbiE